MADVTDVLYRLRDMANTAAITLREQIAEAQTVLDKLDKFAQDAEDAVVLFCSSDLQPDSSANIPEGSGFVRKSGGTE